LDAGSLSVRPASVLPASKNLYKYGHTQPPFFVGIFD